METMRDSWTDERLDDFAANTERRFDRLERQVDARFDKVDARLDRIDGRIDALHHTLNRGLLQFGVGLIVTIGLGFAGLIFGH